VGAPVTHETGGLGLLFICALGEHLDRSQRLRGGGRQNKQARVFDERNVRYMPGMRPIPRWTPGRRSAASVRCRAGLQLRVLPRRVGTAARPRLGTTRIGRKGDGGLQLKRGEQPLQWGSPPSAFLPALRGEPCVGVGSRGMAWRTRASTVHTRLGTGEGYHISDHISACLLGWDECRKIQHWRLLSGVTVLYRLQLPGLWLWLPPNEESLAALYQPARYTPRPLRLWV